MCLSEYFALHSLLSTLYNHQACLQALCMQVLRCRTLDEKLSKYIVSYGGASEVFSVLILT